MQPKKRPEYIITAFVLIALSLIGIVVVQSYWSINTYRQTKKRFDRDIDTALALAIEDSKDTYIDSVRLVLIKRLSSPDIQIRIDTAHYSPPRTIGYNIRIAPASIGQKILGLTMWNTEEYEMKRYERRVRYQGKSDLTRLIAALAVDSPDMTRMILGVLKDIDVHKGSSKIINYLQNNMDKDDQDKISNNVQQMLYSGVNTLPKNYRSTDSARMAHAYKWELRHRNIWADFKLVFSDKDIPHKAGHSRYSETKQYNYKFHGFVYFDPDNKTKLNVRATFKDPQYTVIRNMVASLMISALLILTTAGSFIYVLYTLLKQKKLAELKDDFINNMTHELKTPIATITVAIEGLQNFNALNDPEKTKRYLQISREQLTKLNQLVTKVLNVAAFESKNVDLHIEEVGLDEMVNNIIASEKERTDKQVHINYSNPDQITTIKADRLHFNNVLLNLVDNAVKYAGAAVDINIAIRRHDAQLIIVVKDNGIGIPAEHIAHIFDKFYRVPTGNVHNVKGTGLGLSYVKYIVEAHGGSITVKSTLGSGSEFIVTLPLDNNG